MPFLVALLRGSWHLTYYPHSSLCISPIITQGLCWHPLTMSALAALFSSHSHAFSLETDTPAYTAFYKGTEYSHSLEWDEQMHLALGMHASRCSVSHPASSIPVPHFRYVLAFILKIIFLHSARRWPLTSITTPISRYCFDSFKSKEMNFYLPSLTHRSNSPRDSDWSCLGDMFSSKSVTVTR